MGGLCNTHIKKEIWAGSWVVHFVLKKLNGLCAVGAIFAFGKENTYLQ